MHAREWAAPSTVLFMMSELLKVIVRISISQQKGHPTGSFKCPGQQDSTIEVLGRFQWHLIPVLNPDGYALTWLNKTVLFVHGWVP